MKPRLPVPILILLTTTALGLTTTITGGDDFWENAAANISEGIRLLLGSNVHTGGANDLVVNSDLTVTAPSGTSPSLHIDTSLGGVVVSSGKTVSFTGLKDISIGGTTTGSKKAGTTASQSSSYWPTTGGVFIGEGASMSLSGNSGSVSNSGNGYSSSISSSSSGAGGAAYFVAQNGKLDLNNNAGGVDISHNTVTLSAAGTEAYGAGIFAYSYSAVNICGNASVSLNDNGVSSSLRSASGAAIYAHQSAVVTIQGNSGTVDISRNTAVTTYNYQQVYGGAIGMAGGTKLIIADNEAVSFTGNSAVASGSGANAYAGAIRIDNILSITGNGSVLFEGNRAQGTTAQVQGGAIRNAGSGSITISGNGSVRFIGNTAVTADSTKTTQNRMGGAIYSGADLTLSDNAELLFSGNSVRSGATAVNNWNALGGAIYASKNLLISGNDSVVFEKNYEQRGSNIILRGLYQRNVTAATQLQLSANEGGSIIFREAMKAELTHADSRAVFNGSYDKSSHTYTQTGSGDIIFSGATTRADLNAVKSALGLDSATSKEVSDSLRSIITSESAVLGGRLLVEDNAVLELSENMTIFSGATLSLSRGAYLEEAQELIVQSGGTLSFCEGGELAADSVTMGENSALLLAGASNVLTATSFSMGAGSVVSITLNEAQLGDLAALTLMDVDVSAPLLSGITLELGGFEQVGSGSYKLFTIWGTEEITTYDTSSFTLRGEGVDASAFRWDADEQTLFYDYVSPDIVVNSSTGDLVLDTPTVGNIIVCDAQIATLNSALEAGGTASGDIIIEHGTAAIGEGGSLSGSIIFSDEEPEALRTLELAIPTTISAIELRAAEGNAISVTADTATVSRISGTGALEKQGSGVLILSGSESRVQGELTVQSGTLQLQDGASVKADSIILGSRARTAVTAEMATNTLSITPQNGIGRISDHVDLSSDSTALGGTAERPAQLENVMVKLTQALEYSLNDAVLSGSRVELAESGAALQASGLVLDSTSSLCAAEGASITLLGDNTLVVATTTGGTVQHEGLSFVQHLSEQLEGVTLAAGGTLRLNLSELNTTATPYIALFFKGLSSEVDAAAYGLDSTYRLLDVAHADSGLTLYMEQVPEPTVPVLLLGALGGLIRRRRCH